MYNFGSVMTNKGGGKYKVYGMLKTCMVKSEIVVQNCIYYTNQTNILVTELIRNFKRPNSDYTYTGVKLVYEKTRHRFYEYRQYSI